MTQNTAHTLENTGADAQSDADRRRHFRADIPLKARYLTKPGEEFPCLVSNISAGGALLRAKKTPPLGEQVVLYIDDVGRFEGKVIRSGKHSFAVDYRKRRAKSKRTADTLMQAMNNKGSRIDRRIAPRIKSDTNATLILENGDAVACEIRDISLTGASIAIDPPPPLGSQVQLGKMTAKIVRRHDTGVGVVFTGSVHHMEDVIEKTAVQDPSTQNGPAFAKSFGKKDTTS